MEEDEKGYSPQLWKGMADQGWCGLIVPPEQGGSGMGFLDLVVLTEEFGRALVPGPFLSTQVGGAIPLLGWGTDAQKQAHLPKIAAGEEIWTLAVTEPVRALRRRGRADGGEGRGRQAGAQRHEAVRPRRARGRLHVGRGAHEEGRRARRTASRWSPSTPRAPASARRRC